MGLSSCHMLLTVFDIVAIMLSCVTVPGDGGSQYEGKWDKPSVVHWLCTKKTESWYPLWLNLELLTPYVVDCFVDNMK